MNAALFKTFAPGDGKVFKDIDRKSGTIRAYYSAFGNTDGDGDIGVKGMTLKSISETGPKSPLPRIKHFLNHDITQPISKLTDMGEDDFGPWYEGVVGTHNLGVDFLKQAESGLITEHSYMLKPVRVSKTAAGQELHEVKVFEVSSLTAWGANPLTPIMSLSKSLSKDERLSHISNKIKAIERFCRNTDATDETIQSLLIFIKQLEQSYYDLANSTPAADKAPEPQTQDYSGLLNNITSLKTLFK